MTATSAVTVSLDEGDVTFFVRPVGATVADASGRLYHRDPAFDDGDALAYVRADGVRVWLGADARCGSLDTTAW